MQRFDNSADAQRRIHEGQTKFTEAEVLDIVEKAVAEACKPRDTLIEQLVADRDALMSEFKSRIARLEMAAPTYQRRSRR